MLQSRQIQSRSTTLRSINLGPIEMSELPTTEELMSLNRKLQESSFLYDR